MKKLLIIIFVCLLQNSFATNYYISASGSDANNGTSTSTPWQNISKLNSATFSAGDSIFFKSGDNWTGTFRMNQSGAAGNPIYIGAYGTGAKPEINGWKSMGTWTSVGGGIYKTTIGLSSNLQVVEVNGAAQMMGRYPNTGMLAYTAKTSTSIIYHTIPSNLSGGTMIIRNSPWSLGKNTIISISNDTINFNNSTGDAPVTGYGFFIQNNVNTLDTLNEWYYDGTDLYMYFGATDPNNYSIKAASIDTLLRTGTNKSYITIDGLAFEGANSVGVFIDGANTVVKNCTFKNIGDYGIRCSYGNSGQITTNNTFDNCYGSAIFYDGGSANVRVTKNNFLNTNKIIGSGNLLAIRDIWGDAVCFGSGNYALFDSNYIYGCGHNGVRFSSQYDTVRYNIIGNIGTSRGDVGAIYFWKTGYDATGSYVNNNIILPSSGTGVGMLSNEPSIYTDGIYLDVMNNMSIVNNTIISNGMGMLLNQCHNVTVYGNTIYDSKGFGININEGSAQAMTNMSIKKNIIVAKNYPIAYYNLALNQQPVNMGAVIFISTLAASIMPNIGTVDSNYYSRPISNDTLFNTKLTADANWWGNRRTFSSWKSFTGLDVNSTIPSYTISDTSQIRIVYNTGNSSQQTLLGAIYSDMMGNNYQGIITLQPFTSAILVKTGNLPISGNYIQYRGILKIGN